MTQPGAWPAPEEEPARPAPVNPATGGPAAPSQGGEGAPPPVAEAPELAVEAAEAQLVEADILALESEAAGYRADLQRLHAEYANYRKRVERDRDLVRETATARVLGELLPVLDDIGRAREHGDLTGAFKTVGEALEQTVQRLGLEQFGERGDVFDPTVHEALSMVPAPDVTEATVVEVYQPGYRFAGRVARPARVVVGSPAEPGAASPGATG